MNKKKNPKMAQFNVRLPADEKERLRRIAWDANKSISTYVRDLLYEAGGLLFPTIKNNP
jgi:predicted DNA-binding protein